MTTSQATHRPASSHTVPSIRLMARMNATWFYAIGAASLIEAAAVAQAKQLLVAYGSETALGQWVRQCWLPEKIERARLLQEYAAETWPELDWAAARAEFEQAAFYARGARSNQCLAREALRYCLAAAQASVFYGVMSLWAEDVEVRQLMRRSGVSERAGFEHFKQAFEAAHRHERLGLWATFRETVSRLTHARDTVVRSAFEILQGQWSGTPPFPDVSYPEFLARAASITRRDGTLGWAHRVLLRPWFNAPRSHVAPTRSAPPSGTRGGGQRLRPLAPHYAQAAYAA